MGSSILGWIITVITIYPHPFKSVAGLPLAAVWMWGKNLTPILKVLVGGLLLASWTDFCGFEAKPKA